MVQAVRERYRALDAKIEHMEAEEERRWQQARTPARPAFDMAQWKQQDYAESARWEQQQSYQAYQQGEWCFLLQNLQAPQDTVSLLQEICGKTPASC